MLNVLDKFTRGSLGVRVRRVLSSTDVVDVLTDLFILHGPGSVAAAMGQWVVAVGARAAFIEPGSPLENGYIESFNARLRDEFLNGEIFYALKEAQVLIESWQPHYNAVHPHSSLENWPPPPETLVMPSWAPEGASTAHPALGPTLS